MNVNIEQLNHEAMELERNYYNYSKFFRETLLSFQTEHRLHKVVIRKINGTTERGKLEIVDIGRCLDNNILIPNYFVFRPYKENGRLSRIHRKDDVKHLTPSAYFEKLLEIYSPEE